MHWSCIQLHSICNSSLLSLSLSSPNPKRGFNLFYFKLRFPFALYNTQPPTPATTIIPTWIHSSLSMVDTASSVCKPSFVVVEVLSLSCVGVRVGVTTTTSVVVIVFTSPSSSVTVVTRLVMNVDSEVEISLLVDVVDGDEVIVVVLSWSLIEVVVDELVVLEVLVTLRVVAVLVELLWRLANFTILIASSSFSRRMASRAWRSPGKMPCLYFWFSWSAA
ncbi:hypothetical protein BDZ91DRAFT_723809 [Kalaharituber pfeilii]|nr:hypothetical protein BDZ91DRAFT_723809 [Kalaharituber pfeilii]